MSTISPVRVQGGLDEPLSRWLWLVKWLLAIPHYVVLAFLWIAFAVLSFVAFIAILLTGRYPRSVFEFNVGVLRWSWRVAYYTYGALGTDRYPPFTLAEVPEYPAHLEIAYPEQLSRGLVLVKWWLLAIPHYVVIGIFLGGTWFSATGDRGVSSRPGLISALVLIAAVILLFSGQYPRSLHDLVVGLDRWVLRVAAYAGLMTDQYPPFRLDLGGDEPAGAESPRPAQVWTGGRIVSVVIGAVCVFTSIGLLGVGLAGLVANSAGRDAAGYVRLGTQTYATQGYALASDEISFRGVDAGTGALNSLVGKVRVRVTSSDPSRPVFVGLGPSASVDGYLQGVAFSTVRGVGRTTDNVDQAGGPPTTVPFRAGVWTLQAAGPGTQAVVWTPTDGDWTIVAMNANGSRGVTVTVSLAAKLPALPWIAGGLLALGALLLVIGIVLVAIPVARESRSAVTGT